jgi:hypothetical protein
MIDQRNMWYYQAAYSSSGMVLKSVGTGSQYLSTYRDANGGWLDGSNLYRLHLPADVPVVNFWAANVYDTQTRSQIKNGGESSLTSIHEDKYQQNSDGSYDLYFGPEAPDGFESNWVKTNDGDGFFVWLRFYGPTEAFFDKSWQLPNIELVK